MREALNNTERVDMRRRQVALGGTAAVVATAVSAGWRYEPEPIESVSTPASVPESVGISENEEVSAERIDAIDKSQSAFFNYYRDLERPGLERDVDRAIERVDLVLLLQEHFVVANIPDEELRQNVESLVVGLAFAESRFDETAKSEVGALGFLQLMPNTIAELKKADEDETDLVTQIKIAARLVEQTYRHITQTNKADLELILQNHFGGNKQLFSSCFMTPLMINAYNAGMGTLSTMVKKFAATFPDPQSLVDVFEQSAYLTEFDVFIGMSHTAYNESWVSWYKDHAVAYTTRVYAGYEVIREAYKAGVQKS